MTAPGQPYTSRLELAAQADAPGWARRHVRHILRAWGVAGEPLERAELAVSELVTNAVQYGSAPSSESAEHVPYPELHDLQRIVLTIRHMTSHLLIEVFDHDDRPPLVNGELAPWYAESGRGLFIVEAVSKQWYFYLLPTGGKVVWCEIALNAS